MRLSTVPVRTAKGSRLVAAGLGAGVAGYAALDTAECKEGEWSVLKTLGYIALGGVLVVGVTVGGVAYLGYSYYVQALEKAPMTPEEIKEVRELMRAGMTEQLRAENPNISDEELAEKLENVDNIVAGMRIGFGIRMLVTDGDGYITKEDLFANAKVKNSEGNKRLAEMVWKQCDENADGKISTKEFLLALGSAYLPREKQLELSFKVLDEDGDGQLSKDEMCFWLRSALYRAFKYKRNYLKAPSPDEVSFGKANAGLLTELDAALTPAISKLEDTFKSDAFKSLEGAAQEQLMEESMADYYAAAKVEVEITATKLTEQIFAKYDTSRDGRLQKEEFMKIADGTMPMAVVINTSYNKF